MDLLKTDISTISEQEFRIAAKWPLVGLENSTEDVWRILAAEIKDLKTNQESWINHKQKKKKKGKPSNTWGLKNILVKNEWVHQEIKENIKKYMEANENENTTVQTLWDAAKAVLRGKYIAIQAYLKKQDRSQIRNLTLHLKKL